MSKYETNDSLHPDDAGDAQAPEQAAADATMSEATQAATDTSGAESTSGDAMTEVTFKRVKREDLDKALPSLDAVDETVVQPAQSAPAASGASVSSPVFAGYDSFDLEADAEPPKKRRRWPTVLLALVVLLGAAYLAGAVVFMSRFLPQTSINGEDVSLKTLEEVAKANSDSVEGFSFKVEGDGVDLTLGASDVAASYDGHLYARAAMQQQRPWFWPLEIANHHELTVESRLSYDATRFEDCVGSAIDAVNKDAKPAEDAKISYDEKTKRYQVVPEVLGTQIDKAGALKQAKEALDAGEGSVTLGDDLLIKPEVLSDDEKLNKAVDEVNASFGATQSIVTRDTEVATVDEDQLHAWVKLEDDLTVSFDEEACTKWCQKDLSEKLDTIGSKRSFKLPDGRNVTVEGGTYGWCCDGADIASHIAENVRAGNKGTIEVSWKVSAEKWNPGGQDWGDKFVEIDLGSQHVKLFDGGKVTWESDCVTGKTSDGHGTPAGVYYINDNMQSGNVELRGEIDPKTNKPEYISYVKYWMPFINNGYALHDADWRSSFGGDIYVNDGSHGCVNLPPDKAKELYGMVGVGTVVVVHN